ncbi:hypothetical protein J3R30DRAFT_1094255 [Lentinula aciculospora]|uniref:Uncharacterized protein n=1 Tax=Lentinula aciculospora TaxID=153920 RepID=A0A9W9DHY8_9AGAR|nr:hypothetical protein J3R30DRAFT_1094255 [Lentinula aciculospora]
MKKYGQPEFDCDSASATSSTLVITPSSGHDILKRHTQSGSIVHCIQKSSNINLSHSPQLPRLQPLPSYLQSSMYRPQSAGKGPIQPHISNLPRRKPRQSSTGVLQPTLVKPDAVKSLSSASIRTNAARSPSPHRSSSSSSSSQSVGPKAYFVDDEPSPSVVELYVKPITPTAPALELGHSLPPSKGHIQPHVNNMPRRRPRRPQLSSRTHTTTEQRRLRDIEAWLKERCVQEVIKGSGVWVAFWEWENASEENDDREHSGALFAKESLSAERVIQVIYCDQAADGDAQENVLKLFLPRQAVRAQDDGVPHLSLEQISLARNYLSEISSSTNVKHDLVHTTSTSSSSMPPTPTTISTPSLSRSSSSPTSPFASSLSSPYPLVPSSIPSGSNIGRRLLITVPSRECAVDALALVVVVFSLLGDIPLVVPTTADATSCILDFLIRLQDLEGLDHHWRGALSCDGVEWLEGVLGLGRQDLEA